MTTLLTALFYLWLVITILLVAMWFLRRQDQNREADHEPDHDHLPRPWVEVAAEGSDSTALGLGAVPDLGATEQGQQETAPSGETSIGVFGPTVVDLLDGATLPFDLVPMTGTIQDPDRHAIFLSSHSDVEAVGTAFADELTGLGYDIKPAGLDQATASRGDDVLSMRISPEAGTVQDGDLARYPAAADSDVAIEVWIGQGPPPPLM